MLSERWHIKLLNGLEVAGNGRRIDRFRGRTTAEVLALLVINSHRFVSREEAAGVIWPDSVPESARAGLRTALTSLRSQLEPPGTPANTVLHADRINLRLTPDSFTSDILDYRIASELADSKHSTEVRLGAALKAISLYTGELLPGNYSEWVLAERSKLHQSFRKHVSDVIYLYRATNRSELAIAFSNRLIEENVYDEDPYLLTIRLCVEANRYEDALHCFENLKRMMYSEFKATPSAAAHELEQLARNLMRGVKPPSPSFVQDGQAEPVATAHRKSDVDLGPENAADLMANTAELTAHRANSVGLPVPLTRFFGRETEIMQIVRMICPDVDVGSHVRLPTPQRLITITGAGGTGKTRLATEIGTAIHKEHNIPLTYVSLSEISDPERIPDTIARTLDVSAPDSEDLLKQIVTTLSGTKHLLILDNFEQLLANAAAMQDDGQTEMESGVRLYEQTAHEIVRSLLESAPSLCCLITSRQRLDIEGEQEYPLPPLATPSLPATPERLLDFASVKLFVDRAQLSRPGFQLTERNADTVGSLCFQLDGIPLALELAAAWSSSLSATQIQDRLTRRFELLVGRKPGRTPRQASLRATIEWSFQLLSPTQQRYFNRLSVFRGGWTEDGAAHVCEGENALDTLAALRDRSLVVVDDVHDSAEDLLRYRLLESLREFGEERLTSDETVEVRRRHLEFYSLWTESAFTHWNKPSENVWLHRVALEEENIQGALTFSLRDNNDLSVVHGLQTVSNLGQYWSLRGNYREIRAVIEQFLQHPVAQSPGIHRARALNIAGGLACFMSDWDAAKSFYEEHIQLLRHLGTGNMGAAEMCLGNVALETGDLLSANRLYQNALLFYELANNVRGVAATHGALGYIAALQGDYCRAIPYALEAVALQRQQGNISGTTHHLKQLGFIYGLAGELSNARPCFAESMLGYQSLKDLRGLAELFSEIAQVFPITEDSVRLLGAAHGINARIFASPVPNHELIKRCHEALGAANFESAWNSGAQLSSEEAVEIAGNVLEGQLTFPK